jgi:hypothetical protein
MCVVCEYSHHFFFDCDKYTDNREILFNSLNWLPSNINIQWNDIICIEINKQRMIIYKNIGLDNIRKKKKRKENKYFWRCLLVL